MDDPLDTYTARQFFIHSPGLGEIVTADLAPRQDGEVLVRALYSGISRGTEALVFRGEVPVSQREAMRAPFQEGEFPGPVKYGYSSVGEVLEGPSELEGRAVFCLYPHQDLYCVPASAVAPLPAGLPEGRAVLAANMETALNAVWDARPGPGDRIVVVGAGVVGLLVAFLCERLPGARVVTFDIDPGRADVADALGLSFTAEPPVGAEADLVVHASGHESGLRTALAAAGTEATVLELSWYGNKSVTLPLGEAFHSRRLTLKSSQVGRIPADRAVRWDPRRRMAQALELLLDPRLDALISGESDFEDLPRALSRLSRDPAGVLCHRVRYSHDDLHDGDSNRG
jgi:threonine dehydrogenase-like Zn-dependent dehydrogenase